MEKYPIEENYSRKLNSQFSHVKQNNIHNSKEDLPNHFINTSSKDILSKGNVKYVNRNRYMHRYNPIERSIPSNRPEYINNRKQNYIQYPDSTIRMKNIQVHKPNAISNSHNNNYYNKYHPYDGECKNNNKNNGRLWNNTQDERNEPIEQSTTFSWNNIIETNNNNNSSNNSNNNNKEYPNNIINSFSHYYANTSASHEIHKHKTVQREQHYKHINTHVRADNNQNSYYTQSQRTFMYKPTNPYSSTKTYVPEGYNSNKRFKRNEFTKPTKIEVENNIEEINKHTPIKNEKWNFVNCTLSKHGTQKNKINKKKKKKKNSKPILQNKGTHIHDEIQKVENHEEKKHFCKYCDEYVDEHKIEEHEKNEHVKCPMEGCNNIYKKDNLEYHLLSHMKNKNNEVILNNPKEIQRWIEERKKNYPLKCKIENEQKNQKNLSRKKRNKPNCLIEELIFENYCSAIGKNLLQKQKMQKSVFIPLLNRLNYSNYDNIYENEYYSLGNTLNRKIKNMNYFKMKNHADTIDTLHIHKSPPLLYQIMREEIYSYEQKLMEAIEYITSCNFFDESEDPLIVSIDNNEQNPSEINEELQNV